ncbi:MAG: hypothetical protein U0744_15445 [Gemmataceae bacterium]
MLFAWTDRVHGFAVEVYPGDVAIAKGESVIITAKVVPDFEATTFPDRAEFLVKGRAPVSLRPDGEGTFATVYLATEAETEWSLRVGSRTVGPFRLRAIDPAKLAHTQVRITAPRYVSADHGNFLATNPSTFSALQYSHVAWSFSLDRPARAVWVHHVFGGKKRTTPLAPANGVWSWQAIADHAGQHEATLETEVEEGVKWRTSLPSWSVWTDHPPQVVEPLNDGSVSAERVAAVGDRLRLKAIVEDAVGLELVHLEWRIGDGLVNRMPLHSGSAKPRVISDLLFSLEGKAKEGDRIAFRVRASDGRRMAKGEAGLDLPSEDLLPQTTADPPDDEHGGRWLEYRVSPKAEPWHKKLIFAQRDEIAEELDAIREKLEKERKDLHAVRPMFHQAGGITGEIGRRLEAIATLNRESATRLNRLGMKALGMSGLAPLGRLAQDIARRELGASEASLAKASAKDAIAALREREIDSADAEVRKALDRLSDLRKVNDVLAQARLEQEELERFALREDAIADKAADEVMTKDDSAKLAEEQAKLAEDFEKFSRESPQGKALAAKMQQAKAAQLAKQAQDLAIRQRKFGEARADAMRKKFQDLAVRFAEGRKASQKIRCSEKEIRARAECRGSNGGREPGCRPHSGRGDFEQRCNQEVRRDDARKRSDALANDVDLAVSPREKAKRLAERQQQLMDRLSNPRGRCRETQPRNRREVTRTPRINAILLKLLAS